MLYKILSKNYENNYHENFTKFMQINFRDKQVLQSMWYLAAFLYQQFLIKGKSKLPFIGNVNIDINGNRDLKNTFI